MRDLAMALARTRLGGFITRTLLSVFPSVIPGDRILETQDLIAYHHLDPSYAVHILIVPKAAFATMEELVEARPELLTLVFRTALDLVQQMNLAEEGYRLIVNGGSYQHVKAVHFHLVSGDATGRA